MLADDLISDLGKILSPLGYDAERIRQEIAVRKAKAVRQAQRNAERNESLCKRAIGKTFTIRTGRNTTLTGVIVEAAPDNERQAFRVVLLQSGQYRQGPYYVKHLPT